MPKIIKIRCNGPGKHINEVDLDKALHKDSFTIYKSVSLQQEQPFVPDRLVLPCKQCTEGQVVITNEIINKYL